MTARPELDARARCLLEKEANDALSAAEKVELEHLARRDPEVRREREVEAKLRDALGATLSERTVAALDLRRLEREVVTAHGAQRSSGVGRFVLAATASCVALGLAVVVGLDHRHGAEPRAIIEQPAATEHREARPERATASERRPEVQVARHAATPVEVRESDEPDDREAPVEIHF